MSNHRKPPRPASWCAPKGVCRWCGLPVLNPKGEPTKGRWHPNCVEAFKLIHWPAVTRRAVFERDKGICARCGVDSQKQIERWNQARSRSFLRRMFARPIVMRHFDRLQAAAEKRLNAMGSGWANGAWQHDHIRPLVEANGDVSFWALDNIQTLCGGCHVAKGKEDNRRRKLARQVVVQMDLLAV